MVILSKFAENLLGGMEERNSFIQCPISPHKLHRIDQNLDFTPDFRYTGINTQM